MGSGEVFAAPNIEFDAIDGAAFADPPNMLLVCAVDVFDACPPNMLLVCGDAALFELPPNIPLLLAGLPKTLEPAKTLAFED